MLRRTFIIAAALLGLAGPAAAQPAPTTFTSDRITVTTAGTGPDVVLIHGLGSSRRVWDGLVRAVPGYRYHLVQVAGYGGAPTAGNAGEGLVAAPVAAEIARYIGAATPGRAAVIGHSMGGTIGMMVAARSPERVSRLMVVDSLPFLGQITGPNATPESVRPMADQMRAAIAAAPTTGRRAQAEATINSMINTASMRAGPIEDSVNSDLSVVARGMHELFTTDLRPELARISVPTTVLYVRPARGPFTAEQLDGFYRASYATLRGARLQRVDDSAHFIMLDQADRFHTEVRGFLGG